MLAGKQCATRAAVVSTMGMLDNLVAFRIADRVFVMEIVAEGEAAIHLDPLRDIEEDRDDGPAIEIKPARA
jgi:hypothetical protein